MSPTRVRLREGSPRIAPGPKKHAKALIVMMIGFAFSCIGMYYLPREHPAVAVVSSLLSGFAPLIGLFVLLIILALLFSYLICAAERMLANEDDGVLPEPHLKSKWHDVTRCLPDLFAHRLSLKEHSPPALRFS